MESKYPKAKGGLTHFFVIYSSHHRALLNSIVTLKVKHTFCSLVHTDTISEIFLKKHYKVKLHTTLKVFITNSTLRASKLNRWIYFSCFLQWMDYSRDSNWSSMPRKTISVEAGNFRNLPGSHLLPTPPYLGFQIMVTWEKGSEKVYSAVCLQFSVGDPCLLFSACVLRAGVHRGGCQDLAASFRPQGQQCDLATLGRELGFTWGLVNRLPRIFQVLVVESPRSL